MAEFGFESNEDYEFQIGALFAAELPHLRCLEVRGESGRRKTAFAHALAQALSYPHIVYHDCSAPVPPTPTVLVRPEEASETSAAAELAEAAPTPFERALIEACAFSEAARTVLVLDQLQTAEFRDHIRLYQFIDSGRWAAGSAHVAANPRNLLIMVVSEQPLYHSLAKRCYRVFTDARAGQFNHRPEDFNLGPQARALFSALAGLFSALGSVPTTREFALILADLLARVRTEEHLRHTLYGWMEHIDPGMLTAPALRDALAAVVRAGNELAGVEEVVMTQPPT
jgi:hypothetical protein